MSTMMLGLPSGAALVSPASNHFGSVPCCAYSLKLLNAHPVEEIVQAHLLCAINPLASRIDLRVSLDSRNNGGGGHVYFAGPLDDPLQCGADISLALCKQPEGVRMTVDAGAVCESIFPRNDSRATPRDEIRLNLFPLGMRADGAIPLVTSHTDWLIRIGH